MTKRHHHARNDDDVLEDAALLSALALPPEGSAGRDHPTVSRPPVNPGQKAGQVRKRKTTQHAAGVVKTHVDLPFHDVENLVQALRLRRQSTNASTPPLTSTQLTIAGAFAAVARECAHTLRMPRRTGPTPKDVYAPRVSSLSVIEGEVGKVNCGAPRHASLNTTCKEDVYVVFVASTDGTSPPLVLLDEDKSDVNIKEELADFLPAERVGGIVEQCKGRGYDPLIILPLARLFSLMRPACEGKMSRGDVLVVRGDIITVPRNTSPLISFTLRYYAKESVGSDERSSIFFSEQTGIRTEYVYPCTVLSDIMNGHVMVDQYMGLYNLYWDSQIGPKSQPVVIFADAQTPCSRVV